MYLSGCAHSWFSTLNEDPELVNNQQNHLRDWDRGQQLLIDKYHPADFENHLQRTLNTGYIREGEDTRGYYNAKMELCNNLDVGMDERTRIHYFTKGSQGWLAGEVTLARPRTTTEWLEAVGAIYEAHRHGAVRLIASEATWHPSKMNLQTRAIKETNITKIPTVLAD